MMIGALLRVLATAALAFGGAADGAYSCAASASITIVESIPVQMTLGAPTSNDTFDAWHALVRSAKTSVDIAAFYVRLLNGTQYPPVAQGWKGKQFFADLADAVARGVRVRLVQNMPNADFPDTDSVALAAAGVDVRSLDWTRFTPLHDGILHTKMMLTDADNVYLGSANLDWTSLSNVKELGAVVQHCRVVADDALKVFNEYWLAANATALPNPWPPAYATAFNRTNPMQVALSGAATAVFLSASPAQYVASGREPDGSTIVANIDSATASLAIEVMDYYPYTEFSHPNFYWGDIDDAIRRANFRGVSVRLLFSLWDHSSPNSTQYWASLNALDNVEVRLFVVPPLKGSPPIPFSRVQHAKFMLIDDQVAYIGTSNLTPDYFLNTGGLGWTINSTAVAAQIRGIFDRDWASSYANLCC
jgi:phospholipase D3/4